MQRERASPWHRATDVHFVSRCCQTHWERGAPALSWCLCVCISHGPLGRLALSSLLSGVCMCLNAVNICFNTTSNSVPLSFGKNCLTPYFLISIKLFLPLKLDIYSSKCNILLALQEQTMGQNPKCPSHHETQTTL